MGKRLLSAALIIMTLLTAENQAFSQCVPPSPTFTFNPDNSCSGTSITFNSANQGGVTYSWSFGDGGIASGSNVSHTYSSTGTGTANFTVTLTASAGAGCTSNSTQTVNVIQAPPATLLPGTAVDTTTFNGFITFYQCAAGAQQIAFFTFINPNSSATGLAYTILWGDTGSPFNTSSPWTSTSHIYTRGIYNLTYIVTNSSTGCSDTSNYRVFFGSNPGGGIASMGNTDICGPGWLSFLLTNFQNNSPGTIYTVSFNDGTPSLHFNQPPPDSVAHYFQKPSCGVTSTDGANVFQNSFAVSLTIQNPCGTTAAAVLPIYVSTPPIADYAPPGQACAGVNNLYVNTTQNGEEVGPTGCDDTTAILWKVIPDTGWTLTVGSLGSDNGFTGPAFSPGLWTSGSNTLGINFTSPGDYEVMLIAANNCGPDTVIKKACVSVVPSPTFVLASAGSPIQGCTPLFDSVTNTTPSSSVCSGTSYTWTVSPVSNTCTPDSPFNYKILSGSITDSNGMYIGFYNQGVYNITLSAQNACGTVSTAPQTITVNAAPQIGLTIPGQVCIQQSIIPQANPQDCGTPITAYSWTFNGASPASSTSLNPGSITYSSAGSYNISLSATNQCGTYDTIQSITVEPNPVANAGGPSFQYCAGDSVQIGTAPIAGMTYSWSPPTGLSSSTVSNPIVSIINTGTTPVTQTYYLTVTNGIGCSSTDSTFVTVNPGALVTAGPDEGACAGKSLTLAGSIGGAATSATWSSSNGGTFSNINSPTSQYTPSITSGSVTLTLTTNQPGACPAASSSVTITVVAAPTANAGSNVSVCSGDSVKIGSAHLPGYHYHWSPSTGLSSTTSANPTVSLINTGTTVLTQTYTLVVSAVGCSDTAQVTVSVYPAAGANAGPPASVCAGSSVTLNGSISGAATSAMWSSINGTFSQPDSLTTVFTPSITSGNAVVTLTTNQPSASCNAAVSQINIQVNPLPIITAIPTDQTICSGGSSQTIQFNSSDSSTAYSWTASSPNGVTGFSSGSGSFIPPQTLNYSGTGLGITIYHVVPTAAGCTGPGINDTVFVNPFVTMNPVAPQTVCSGTSAHAINFTSSLSGVLYNWSATADANMGGYAISGTGTIPAQTITNSSTAADSVVYTIIPSAGGCNGNAVNVKITILPAPTVNTLPSQTICTGTSTTPVILSSDMAGVSYTWIASASTGISGYRMAGTGNIPAQILTNADSTAGRVIYTVNASAGGCTGPNEFFIINVEPSPVVSALPAIDTLCTGMPTNIALTASMAGSTFNWTVNASSGLTGASPGSGAAIQQTLTDNDTIPQLATYFVTATAGGCTGLADTVSVWVQPGTLVQFSQPNQNICSGQSTQIVYITGSAPGANYSWAAQANGVNGVILLGADSIPAQTLSNSGNAADTVVYTINVSGGGCPGQVAYYKVIVAPQPNVILPATQTICAGNSTNAITLSSGETGTTFNWTAISTNGVTGYTASGSSSIIPSQTLQDTSATSPATLTYTITPSFSGCTGSPSNYLITVNPAATVNPIGPQDICSGSTTQAVTPTGGATGTVFNWKALGGTHTTGFAYFGTGTIPAATLVNNSFTTDTIVYQIIPTVIGCQSNTANFAITIKPLPDVILPAAQGVCSGVLTDTVNLNSDVAGTSFSWTALAPTYLSGYIASGNGSIPPQTVVSTDTITDTVNYTIVPVAQGCTGASANYNLTINPAPVVNPSAAADSVCTGTQTNISLTSNFSSVTFSWVVNAPGGITGAASGNGNTIQQMLTNNTANAQTVTYIISPSAAACMGVVDTLNVLVKPTPNVQFGNPPQTICSGQSTQAVSLNSSLSGTTFQWTAQANGIAGVTASGSGIIPSQTLTNTGSSGDTVFYTVTASNGSCPGQSAIYPVVVNPGPSVNLPSSQTVCSGSAIDSVIISSGVSGTTFSWTASSATVTGFVTNGSSSVIPGSTLNNPTDSIGTVIYNITASGSGCSGPAAQYTVQVNPSPSAIAPGTQVICNNTATTAVALTSSAGGATYTWTSKADSGISGNTVSGTGNIPSQTLQNSGNGPVTVIYTIIASANGCSGSPTQYMVTVNPTPAINFSPAQQTICSGQTTSPVLITSPTTGANISWTATIPQGIKGADTTGSNLIPNQTLYNNNVDTFPIPLTIQYNVQVSTTTGCPGNSSTYAVTVLPAPQVNFNLSLNSGCPPLVVNAIPNTLNYGNPDSVIFNWGDGSPTQVLRPSSSKPMWQSLGHTFYNNSTTTQVYYVSMKAQTACYDTTITYPVTVLPGNVNAFFSPSAATGCEPLTVTFRDQSQGAGLVSWCFNYDRTHDSCIGGGIVDSAGTTVTHTFMAGTYTVALYATNGGGCGQDTAYQTITVTPSPVAAFQAGNVPCAASNINFTTQSTAPSGSFITGYTWQFGDGDSSSAQNPQHIYNSFGNYTVCLTVSSSLGCSNTVCDSISVSPKPTLDFTYTNACINQQGGQFNAQTSGAAYFEWNFGDGTTATGSSANHIYNAAGTYSVTLIGSSGTCADTTTHSVIIYPIPAAAFVLADTVACGFTSPIGITNTSTNASGYYWDFGNGSTSTMPNPAPVYASQGTFTIQLVASNTYNCYDTARHSITINPYPNVQGVTVTPAEGCKPVNVAFFAQGTNINSIIWNFGDGATITTNEPITTHLYADSGTFTVQLTVYSAGGCNSTIILPDTVTVHGIPTAAFDYVINEAVEPENGTVQFVNESLNSVSYLWNFGDGNTSTDVNPLHMFANIDKFQVMLVASNQYGCKDTAIKDIDVLKKSLYAPNAFAPQFSGVNNLVNVWKPAGMGLSTYHAQIFDKWGELLWESTALTDDLQPAEGWDGTYQGKLCQQDVYVWKIDATFVDGSRWKGMSYPKEPERKTIGSVTLIR